MQMPMTQDQMDYEMNWQMPDIKISDQITYYKQWNSTREPLLGFVIRISARSLEVLFFEGRKLSYIEDVLHKDDPRLQRNQYSQSSGSWDYSRTELRLRALEERLTLSQIPPIGRPAVFTEGTGLTEIMYGSPGSCAVPENVVVPPEVAKPSPENIFVPPDSDLETGTKAVRPKSATDNVVVPQEKPVKAPRKIQNMTPEQRDKMKKNLEKAREAMRLKRQQTAAE